VRLSTIVCGAIALLFFAWLVAGFIAAGKAPDGSEEANAASFALAMLFLLGGVVAVPAAVAGARWMEIRRQLRELGE
jgi:hypothetical protein